MLPLLAAVGPWSAAASRELTPRLVHNLALPSVVGVESESRSGETFSATGFFVAPGVLATALHAVTELTSGRVILEVRGRTAAIARVIASDRERDIALVSVPAALDALPLPMAMEPTAQPGDRIYVLGNPEGLIGTLVEGNISAAHRIRGRMRLELSLAGSRISAGSPVLDAAGRLIGMARNEVEGGTRRVFAEPAIHIAGLLNDTRAAALSSIAPAAGPAAAPQRRSGMPYWFAAAIVAVVLAALGWHRWREDRAAAGRRRDDVVDRVAGMVVHHRVDPNQLVRFGGGALYDRVLERCRRCTADGLCVKWLSENADGDFPYCPNHDVWVALPALLRNLPPRR